MSTSHDHSSRASTRYSVSCPITVHMYFPVCFALFLCRVLLCLPWHSFHLPRPTFQLHHVTGSWFRHSSCQTLDRFRDVRTILRQVRTTHGSTPEQRCLLSFENWTVLDRICFSSTQFHSWSFDNISLNESKVFQQSRNMFLIRFNLNQFIVDQSDRSVQHFQFFVKMSCCTNHADPSRVKFLLQHFSRDLILIMLLLLSQNRLHGRIHSQALICTMQGCLHQVQSHCCEGVHPTISATHCSHLAFRTSSC